MLKRLWEWIVKPKVLKTKHGGEIVCKNVGPEYVERIKNAISDAPGEVSPVSEPPKELEEVEVVYTKFAISNYKAPNGDWHVVEVGYDPVTKEAKVVSDTRAGDHKIYGIDAFKMKAVEHDLV